MDKKISFRINGAVVEKAAGKAKGDAACAVGRAQSSPKVGAFRPHTHAGACNKEILAFRGVRHGKGDAEPSQYVSIARRSQVLGQVAPALFRRTHVHATWF